MVLAIGSVWVIARLSREVYPQLDRRGRIMFWAVAVAIFGIPAYFGITALAPVS